MATRTRRHAQCTQRTDVARGHTPTRCAPHQHSPLVTLSRHACSPSVSRRCLAHRDTRRDAMRRKMYAPHMSSPLSLSASPPTTARFSLAFSLSLTVLDPPRARRAPEYSRWRGGFRGSHLRLRPRAAHPPTPVGASYLRQLSAGPDVGCALSTAPSGLVRRPGSRARSRWRCTRRGRIRRWRPG